MTTSEPTGLVRAVAAGALVVVLIAGALAMADDIALLASPERVRAFVGQLGIAGPVAVIVLIATAIVVSPLPSAPIAVASGAMYGHVWGTVWVVIGAEAGALIAFYLSRVLGRRFVGRWLDERIRLDAVASQNVLTGVVFVSRLLPFLSFDLVSYAAGLTPLKTWRFAAATLAGIVPMSFLLAHFGGEFATLDVERVTWAVLGLGLVTVVPVAVRLLRRRRDGGGG